MSGPGEPPESADVTSEDRPVEDDTLLYRRVHQVHYKLQEDGSFRIRETAFKNPKDGKDMSVQLGDTLADLGKTPNDVLVGVDASMYGVAAIQAKVVTDEDQTVERTPKPGDEAHGDVVGDKPTGRRKLFASAACWAVPPTPG